MYSKIVLDALVESSSDTDISRMVVVINEYAPYRDYADLHKHNPDWWESLAEKVYTSSVFPKMALAPYLIAASQHLSEIKDKEDVEKVKGDVVKFRKDYQRVHYCFENATEAYKYIRIR